jgi:histidine triad (HIT) family protein
MKKDDCIFCKIAAGEIPSQCIYEDGLFKVILDLGPATKGHSLIIPKDHYEDLFELPEETAAQAMVLAKRLSARLMEKLHADGLNLVQNNKEIAGQTVKHFHLHMIPRYKDDMQNILWKPGEVTQDELALIKETITG